jgi:hypothetical protein
MDALEPTAADPPLRESFSSFTSVEAEDARDGGCGLAALEADLADLRDLTPAFDLLESESPEYDSSEV